MALRIIIDGGADNGKSAVGTLIEELLVSHGFMVSANLNTPRMTSDAANIARSVAVKDPRVVLIEVKNAMSETTRG